MALSDEIEKLQRLKEAGVLTESEFISGKAKLLVGEKGSASAPPQSQTPFPVSSTQTVKSASSPARAKRGPVAVVASVITLAVVAWVLVLALRGATSKDGAAMSIAAGIGAVVRDPVVIVDEAVTVSAGNGSYFVPFQAETSRDFLIEVTGVHDTRKGFDAWIIRGSEWADLKAGRQFRAIESFPSGQGFSKRVSLPSGGYGVAIMNSKNLLNALAVRVKVTSDPK